MNMLHWLLRAKRWAQRPPPPRQVALVLSVVALCVALALVEHFIGWPEALTAERMGRTIR